MLIYVRLLPNTVRERNAYTPRMISTSRAMHELFLAWKFIDADVVKNGIMYYRLVNTHQRVSLLSSNIAKLTERALGSFSKVYSRASHMFNNNIIVIYTLYMYTVLPSVPITNRCHERCALHLPAMQWLNKMA